VNDLNARIRQAERIVAEQNANLAALRHLLGKETGEFIQEPLTPATISSVAARKPQVQEVVDFKGRTSNVILALVRQRNGHGVRPRDIAEILLSKKLMSKGSNIVHSHLSELKKKGLVRQNSEGLYFDSSPSTAPEPATATSSVPVKIAKTKRKISAAGREAIRKAQKARWAAVRKAKG
jgi:hypothetical protein